MDIHEYQAKEILSEFGVLVPRGGLAYSPEQAAYRAREIGGERWVVKAQIHAGGRGKAGGIKLAADSAEARTHAEAILGMDIKGHTVEVVWIEKASDIAEEYYASFTLDRAAKKHLLMLSAALLIACRFYRRAFQAATLLFLLGIGGLAWKGMASANLELLTIGLMGACAGDMSTDRIRKALSHPLILVLLYGVYTAAITAWGISYPFEIENPVIKINEGVRNLR
jgi:hypothetical protein